MMTKAQKLNHDVVVMFRKITDEYPEMSIETGMYLANRAVKNSQITPLSF